MSLESVLAAECGVMTNDEALAHIRDKTVVVDGMASGADVSGVLLSAGLLSLIRDQVNLADTHTKLRNICIALADRFLPDGQIDLSIPGNVSVIDEFLADTTVAGILSVQSLVATDLKAAVMLLGQSPKAEFPNTTIRDVIAIRDPGDVIASESNIEGGKGKNRFHDLKLVVTGDVPTEVHVNIMVRHDSDDDWQRIDGFPAIKKSCTRYRRIPGEFIKAATEIQCQCDYSLNMSLTAVAV